MKRVLLAVMLVIAAGRMLDYADGWQFEKHPKVEHLLDKSDAFIPPHKPIPSPLAQVRASMKLPDTAYAKDIPFTLSKRVIASGSFQVAQRAVGGK